MNKNESSSSSVTSTASTAAENNIVCNELAFKDIQRRVVIVVAYFS
jgi:hypothetical protein